MKKIAVKFTFDWDIIEVPDEIESNIRKIQRQFDKWIHDKNNNHDFWVYRDQRKTCPLFGGEAFVFYLNHYVIKNEEYAKLLEEHVTSHEEGITSIWF